MHLISSSGLLGAEQVLLELASKAKQAGLPVTVGVLKNSSNPHVEVTDAAAQKGVNTQVFPCSGRLDKNTLSLINYYVLSHNVNIVHSHNYKSNFYARLSLPRTGVQWVVTNHGRRTGPFLFFYNLLDTFIVRAADKVVAVSDPIRRQLRRSGLSSEKLSMIDNGIDVDRFLRGQSSKRLRRSLNIEDSAMVIGTIGSLTEEKGHRYLIESIPGVIARFPNALFIFVGSGKERQSLELKARTLGVADSVLFTGVRNDIPDLLSILDAFALPSLREGLPMALLEAQAAHIPVVATNVGAIPTVIKDRETGLLIPPRSPEALCTALCSVLGDPGAAAKMAARAFKRLRKDYSSDTMFQKYLSIYGQVLSQ